MPRKSVSVRVSVVGFVLFGMLSAVCFLYGMVPVGMFLDEGDLSAIPDVETRCPARHAAATEFDLVCARGLVAAGPLQLGEAAFAFSIVFGFASLGSLARRPGAARATAVALGFGYAVLWAWLLIVNAGEARLIRQGFTG
jgi:hypothetical protein